MIRHSRTKYIVVEVSRVILALTLLFSGFVKGVDPMGGAIKIGEYLTFLHLNALDSFSTIFSVALSSIEFLLGACLLMGIWRRYTAWFTMIFMSVMTAVTLYLALFNPISDCGCFGDAIKLTNWQTFGKNIILLLLSVLLLLWYRHQSRVRNRRAIQIAAALCISGWSIFIVGNLRHLPLIDFRPYKVGVSLRDLTMIPENAPQEVVEYTFVYEKEGVQQEFGMYDLPDSTWTYIDRREHVISEGYTPPVMDFSIYSRDEDVTQTLLLSKSPQIWVVSPNWENVPLKLSNKLNELYTWADSLGVAMYGISGSTPEESGRWRNKTGARYPMYYCDAVTIKTIARANPSVLLISDATILDKIALNDLPDEISKVSAQQLQKKLNTPPIPPLHIERWVLLALWLICALFMLTLSIHWESEYHIPYKQ